MEPARNGARVAPRKTSRLEVLRSHRVVNSESHRAKGPLARSLLERGMTCESIASYASVLLALLACACGSPSTDRSTAGLGGGPGGPGTGGPGGASASGDPSSPSAAGPNGSTDPASGVP